MPQRLNGYALSPDAYAAKAQLDTWLESQLDHGLIHLIKMRVSQINHCAYCLHMHREEALKDGDTEKRLLLLDAWRESDLFSDKEKAALNWAESLTHIADTHAPQADFDALKAHFSDKEIVDLSFCIAQINGWNRIAVPLRAKHPQDEAP